MFYALKFGLFYSNSHKRYFRFTDINDLAFARHYAQAVFYIPRAAKLKADFRTVYDIDILQLQ